MVNHRGGAAAFLLIASSLLVAVTLSGADARPTAVPDKTAPALADADTMSLKVSHEDAHPQGLADPAATADAQPECNDNDHKHKKHHNENEQLSHQDHQNSASTAAAAVPNSVATGLDQVLADSAATVDAQPECHDEDKNEHKHHHPDESHQSTTTEAAGPNSEGTTGVEQELCATCEQPKEPPPCDCDDKDEPGLVCKKVHAVRDGETCDSMAKCEELGQDDFLKFNPNICCDHLFVGQWVCLDVECSESD